jgi:hypothetical protein
MPYEFNPNDVHTMQTLTDFSVRYMNEETIWRKVAPIKSVKKRSDKFVVFDKATAFDITDDSTAPNSDANEISLKMSDANYSVNDRALGAWVPVETIENADDPIKPELDAVQAVKNQLENRHELRVAQRFFSAATYPVGNKVTLAGTSQWSDYTNSDPLAALTAQIDALIVRPNKLILGADTWRVLRQHPRIAGAIFPLGGNANRGGTMATAAALADLLELDEVVVGRARVNTANVGAASPTLVRAWGKHALLARILDNPGDQDVTLAVTFSESQSNPVRDFDKKKGVKGSIYIKDGWNEDARAIATDAGFFFENAVA